MAARRRTTLATVSSASLNSRGVGASSSRASLAPAKQATTAASSKPSRFSTSTAGGGRSIGGRPSMGAARSSMGGQRPSMGGQRPSMGGQRPSMGGQRPSLGRPSMSTGERKSSTGVRRSTTYGGGAGGRSDSRPLMDKAHLHECLHKLADYLSSHGYDQPINNKNLSRPSGRDFNNIMGFLFRQIDPNYVVSGHEIVTARTATSTCVIPGGMIAAAVHSSIITPCCCTRRRLYTKSSIHATIVAVPFGMPTGVLSEYQVYS